MSNATIVTERDFRLTDGGGAMADAGSPTAGPNLGMLQGVTPIEELDAAIKGYCDGRGAGGPVVDSIIPWGALEQGFGWYHTNPYAVSYVTSGTGIPSPKGLARVAPVQIGARSFAIDALAVAVETGGAGTFLRMGIYSIDLTTLRPVAILSNGGTVDTSTAGVKILVLPAPVVIPRNSVFVGIAEMVEGAVVGTLRLVGYPGLCDFPLMGKSDIDQNESTTWLSTSPVGDGALPAASTCTAVAFGGSAVFFRRSA